MPDSFYLIWASLLLAPPVALISFVILRRYRPNLISPFIKGSLWIVLIVAGFSAISTSFTATLANVIFVSAAYWAYSFLAVAAWTIRPLITRILALMIALSPIAIGYFIGTIGFLGLMFIVGDYTRPPHKTEQMSDNLLCHITGWGMAASDSGYTVHLYKRWFGQGLIQTEVAYSLINETRLSEGEPDPMPTPASCAELFAEYRKNHTL